MSRVSEACIMFPSWFVHGAYLQDLLTCIHYSCISLIILLVQVALRQVCKC